MEKWAEQKELSLRSKSKSPWRRRGEDAASVSTDPSKSSNSHGLPSPPQTPAQSSESGDHRKSMYSANERDRKARKKTPRRPHTSAGPSDKSSMSFSVNAPFALGRRDPGGSMSQTVSRDSASSSQSQSSSSANKRFKESGLGESMLFAVDKVRGKSRALRDDGKREREAEDDGREDRRERREKVKAKASSLGLRVEPPPPMDEVRAWEEELARIEVQSRRSSSGMLGLFGLSRKRTAR